jgi:hypothetical protein
MRRALVLLATVLLSVTACGGAPTREHAPAGEAPRPADLAADALAALEEKGSAHYDLAVNVKTAPETAPIVVHASGDGSSTRQTADVRFSFGMGELAARLLAGEHEFFVQFMGTWYGTHMGLADARERAGAGDAPDFTPDWVRDNFDTVFTGSVDEGPTVDGAATWEFAGQLNPDGFAELSERYGRKLTPEEKEGLRKLADRVHFVLVVGRDDNLPRRIELRLNARDLQADLGATEFGTLGVDAHATLALSEFGKTVDYNPPARFEPLEKLFDQFSFE